MERKIDYVDMSLEKHKQVKSKETQPESSDPLMELKNQGFKIASINISHRKAKEGTTSLYTCRIPNATAVELNLEMGDAIGFKIDKENKDSPLTVKILKGVKTAKRK